MATSTTTSVEDLAKNLDSVTTKYSLAALEKTGMKGNFLNQFAVAGAMAKLRSLITPEVIQRYVMPLKNTKLGFMTDEADRMDKGKQPYPMEVVRDCVIEALMRGLSLVGNQFNIISGSTYVTKSGCKQIVADFPGLTDVEMDPGVPKIVQGGALVECVARWKLNGTPMEMKRNIAVKLSGFGGVDAAIGKATRKMYAAIHERVSGTKFTLNEGEVGDSELKPVEGQVVEQEPQPQPQQQSRAPQSGTEAVKSRMRAASTQSPAPQQAPQREVPSEIVEDFPPFETIDTDQTQQAPADEHQEPQESQAPAEPQEPEPEPEPEPEKTDAEPKQEQAAPKQEPKAAQQAQQPKERQTAPQPKQQTAAAAPTPPQTTAAREKPKQTTQVPEPNVAIEEATCKIANVKKKDKVEQKTGEVLFTRYMIVADDNFKTQFMTNIYEDAAKARKFFEDKETVKIRYQEIGKENILISVDRIAETVQK